MKISLHFARLAASIGAVLTLSTLSTISTAHAQDMMTEGKKLFTESAVPACSICHAMKQAGAVGEVGPSLDELKPDAARVEKALRNGIGQMPAFKTLSEAQIKLLSAYVASAVGGK